MCECESHALTIVALVRVTGFRVQPVNQFEKHLRRLRRGASRTEWASIPLRGRREYAEGRHDRGLERPGRNDT